MKQNQFKFKPFDMVLVRDEDNQPWRANIFSHVDTNNHIACITSSWKQCIPYNEETQHLIGTNKPYLSNVKETTYEVTYNVGNTPMCIPYTEEGFKDFINRAVCNNKDIKDFSVNIIIPD